MKTGKPREVETPAEDPAVEESVLALDRSSPELAALTESGRTVEPSVDWDRLESGLFAKLDAEPRRAPARADAEEMPSVSRPWLRRGATASLLPRPAREPRQPVRRFGIFAAGGLALAAASVLAVTQPWRAREAPAAGPTPAHEVAVAGLRSLDEQTRDGTALGTGDALSSGTEPLAVAVRRADGATAVRWTLAPESRVVVRTMAAADGRGQVLALERGAVHADVEPGLGSGAFAVLVEGTRVEVKGTSFRVTRLQNRLEVEVDRGVVGVGMDGRGASELLRAPARAVFAFDGARLSGGGEPQPPPAWVLALRPPAPKEASAPPVELGPVASAPAQARSAPKPAEKPALTVAGVRSALKGCFEQTYTAPSDGSVRLSVVTSLTLTLRADGSVEQAKFDPPLKPEFTQCAQGVIFGRFQGPPPEKLDLSFP